MKKDWFVHVEWVVVLVTLLGGFYTLDTKIANQGQRTDRLYEMWVESNEKWSDRWMQTQKQIAEMIKRQNK